MNNQKLPLLNIVMIAVSVLIIVIGFFITAIGQPSGAEYNPDIFSLRRVTIGPMTSLFGFILMIVAIIWPSKNRKK